MEGIPTPKIKVVKPKADSAVEHAYDPHAAPETCGNVVQIPVRHQSEKLVGQMNKDEFLEILVQGLVLAKQQETIQNRPIEEEKDKGPISKVLGTVGDVVHGVVDIAEGMVRGAVDIVTFGQSKRK